MGQPDTFYSVGITDFYAEIQINVSGFCSLNISNKICMNWRHWL